MADTRRWTAQEIAKTMSGATGSRSRQSSGSWICRCPAHNDIGESLSCRDNYDKDNNPVVLFNCFAGCDFVSIVRGLRSYGIDIPPSKPRNGSARPVVPAPRPPPIEKKEPDYIYAPQRAAEVLFEPTLLGGPMSRCIKNTYDWHDEDGRLIFHTVRVVEQNGSKKVMPVTPCTHAETGEMHWRMRGPDGPRPLYNTLNDHGQKVVLVVEGEKTCDAASVIFAKQDVWVTTTHGGSKSAYLTDWSRMRDRKVVIAHDLDQAGLTYAAVVQENVMLQGARSTHLWTIPTSHVVKRGRLILRNEKAKKGYDLADAREDGWTLPFLATRQKPWHGPDLHRFV